MHTAVKMKNYLDTTSFTLMPHLSEFFCTMKNSFIGQDFESDEALIKAIYNFFGNLPKGFWKKIFKEWEIRLRESLEANGDYFC